MFLVFFEILSGIILAILAEIPGVFLNGMIQYSITPKTKKEVKTGPFWLGIIAAIVGLIIFLYLCLLIYNIMVLK